MNAKPTDDSCLQDVELNQDPEHDKNSQGDKIYEHNWLAAASSYIAGIE